MRILRALPLTLMLLMAALLGCRDQPAATVNEDLVARERVGCIRLGYAPDENGFDYCMKSLARSAEAMEAANAVDAYRQTCARQGLATGTAPFDACVAKLKNAATASSGGI
jgi:hypothetical protein